MEKGLLTHPSISLATIPVANPEREPAKEDSAVAAAVFSRSISVTSRGIVHTTGRQEHTYSISSLSRSPLGSKKLTCSSSNCKQLQNRLRSKVIVWILCSHLCLERRGGALSMLPRVQLHLSVLPFLRGWCDEVCDSSAPRQLEELIAELTFKAKRS